jgi:glycosyltransferase involved in cell wall biosynthesis
MRLLREKSIQVIEAPVSRIATPLSFRRLVATLRDAQVDIVHTQAFRANLWGRIAATQLGLPVVASVRATYSYLPRPYYGVERALATRTAWVLTPSRATSQHLVDHVGVPASKVVTIPNAVDLQLFHPGRDGIEIRRRFGLGGKTVVLAAGRLTAQKNYVGLVSAVARVVNSGFDVTLLVAGSGPLERDLKAFAASQGCPAHFVGDLDRSSMADAMAAADIFLMMSDFEGMPNAILEAMAAAKPVVATAVDGVTDLITQEVDGILVQKRDVVGAATAVERLVLSPELRRALGSAGRRRVERRHSIAENVSRHIKLYEPLVDSDSTLGSEPDRHQAKTPDRFAGRIGSGSE